MKNINRSTLIVIFLIIIMLFYITSSLFWQKETNRRLAEKSKIRVIIPFNEIKENYNE